MIDRPDEYAREVAEARSNMACDPKRHDKDCDYHVDQYPWECNCGVMNDER